MFDPEKGYFSGSGENNPEEEKPEAGRENAERIKEEHEDEFVSSAKNKLEEIFDNHNENSERIKDILSRIEPYFASGLIDAKEICQSLEQCSTTEDRDKFIEQTLSSLKPLFDLKTVNPRAFEEIQREVFHRQGEFIKINELLSYGGGEDLIHIHLPPAKEFTKEIGSKRAVGLFQEGLTKLAKVIKDNEKIKQITATSWLVARHPKVLERLGFMIEGEIDEKTKREHFASEKRKVFKASVTREEFLKRYLVDK